MNLLITGGRGNVGNQIAELASTEGVFGEIVTLGRAAAATDDDRFRQEVGSILGNC